MAAVAQFVASFAGRFGAFFIITQKIITLFFFLLLRGLAKQKRRCVCRYGEPFGDVHDDSCLC